MNWRLGVGLTVLVVGPGDALLSQDIEWDAAQRGITLPASYYQLVEQQPDFFTLQPAWVNRAADARAGGFPLGGDLPIVVIPALFADSPVPTYTSSDIDQVYFSGPYVNGTLNEFYDLQSGGRLNVTGTVAPWVRTSLTMAEVVGSTFGLGGDARTGEYLLEAVQLADLGIDFGEFDNDGPDGMPNSGDDDGIVDVVAFEFLEISASCGGPSIWPHRSGLAGWNGQPYATDDLTPAGDPIVVNGYVTQSVVTCDGAAIHSTSTMAHELGHVLGLPDLRHHVGGVGEEFRRWLIGCFGLMSGGGWGCEDVPREQLVNAALMSPYARTQLGWLANERIVAPGEFLELTLPPSHPSEEVLHVPLAGSEHLIIEYRPNTGFDRVLPGNGVLIYHTDPSLPLVPCSECPPLYRVYILEADGRGDLLRARFEGGNRGQRSDMFAVDGPSSLASTGTPSTRLNNGTPSGVEIYEIRIEGGLARVTLAAEPIALERLLQPLLRSSAAELRVVEQQFLDSTGNNDGVFDVGDLRAYLAGH